MTGWLTAALPALSVLLLTLLPGLAVAYGLRLRGMAAWGFAPAAGIAAIAVSAVLLGLVGVRWTLWSASAAMLLLVIVAVVIGRALRPQAASVVRTRRSWAVPAAVTAGALLGMVRMAAVIHDPQNISQTNDATFHLNALRFIQEQGSASSLDVSGVLGATTFYPAAWHGLASLVVDATGTDITVAANAVAIVIAGPLWTLSITAFVRSAVRGRTTASVAAAVMAPSLFAFPFSMLDFGVLYPYALALAVLPGLLALLVAAVRREPAEVPMGGRGRRTWLLTITTLVGLSGIALAQPAVLLNALICAVLLALWALGRGLRSLPVPVRRRRLAACVGVLVAGSVVWLGMTHISSSGLWVQQKPAADAALELLLNASAGPGPMISMSVLALLGVLAALRVGALRWLVVHAAVIALLAVVAVSVQNGTVRGLLAAWYADPHRFVAMMPLVVIPLGAVAVDAAAAWIARRSRVAPTIVAGTLLAAVVAETVVWTAVPADPKNDTYAESSTSYLSTDERDLLESLPDYVGADDRVLGNPSAGAAFGYALSGVDVVPRTWSMPEDEYFQALRHDLVHLIDDPSVCAAVREIGVDYVLDFGSSSDGAGRWEMPGLTGFAMTEGFDKVAQVGAASLWRITACR
ncbi:DUF6541 family protein [Microbacterium soli]|uniref:Glycosyltransferase RgtA/B/C/D-like domain-containing protein n=1 Tax=Microbacterium soli TaxID=446075 RepID=A0ABP7MPE8_9MICO